MSAVAELVDNSVEAGARNVWISVHGTPGAATGLSVLDDGEGMTADTMREALQFGGSSRFGGREGLGRFGMGLPNASLSQARRLDLYSWTSPNGWIRHTHLDVDEVIKSRSRILPEITRASQDQLGDLPVPQPASGTLVRWARADRLDNKRVRTIQRKLSVGLGRVFRHMIWDGVTIFIDGEPVTPIDPLFVHEDSVTTGATLVDECRLEIRGDEELGDVVGEVHIRFSVLPVEEWQGLSTKEKRAKGILNGAGVSIVRAGREVDYGWHFLRGKRRQSYDDWWRCEVRFDPVLDEVFGITHTKQQIRPRSDLTEILTPILVQRAKALHARIRRDYKQARPDSPVRRVEDRATECDASLPPLPDLAESADHHLTAALLEANPALRSAIPDTGEDERGYSLTKAAMGDEHFFRPLRTRTQVIAAVNSEHPFHKLLDGQQGSKVSRARLQEGLEALLLSAARAEAMLVDEAHKQVLDSFRSHWSEALGEFLN